MSCSVLDGIIFNVILYDFGQQNTEGLVEQRSQASSHGLVLHLMLSGLSLYHVLACFS